VIDAIEAVVRRTVRNGELFRKGIIQATGTEGGLSLVQIEERWMPVVGTGGTLATGSIVVYLDSSDPICLGKLAGT